MVDFHTIATDDIDAVIFDLDGVVTDTAGLHARAWQEMFNAFLDDRSRQDNRDYPPFDIGRDYLTLVDGKPRYDGVISFLQSRDLALPFGDPTDEPDMETVCGLGNRKNEIFGRLLREQGADVYPATVDLIHKLKSDHIKVGLMTSSKNGRTVLSHAGLSDLFDAVADGTDAQAQKLEGKPAPDMFLFVARQLDVEPKRTIVVEDALSGVEAGRRGNFGIVIGVDHGDQAEALRRNGADIVVKDLGQIRLERERRQTDAPPRSSALTHFKDIRRRLSEKEPVVFLDYDGTLSPIVQNPEDADLSEDMRAAVAALAQVCTVAIVSGRDLEDVRRRVGLPELYYAGSHGFDIRGPEEGKITHRQGEDFLPRIDAVETLLRDKIRGIQGAQVERKRFSVAVHYRKTPDAEQSRVEKVVEAALNQVQGLRVSSGKKVFDFQPDLDWHKGKAVRWFIDEALKLERANALPLYIGDDITDEDAFAELSGEGITIVVDLEDRDSQAGYALKDTGEVREFLLLLTKTLQRFQSWRLSYRGFDPDNEGLREALCTLGNGYFCTRGALAQATADGTHYPGTYLAGGYNRLKTEIDGHIIENEDLVNMTNWLPLDFRIEDGPWFAIEAVDLLDYRQELDIRGGVLHRRWRYKDPEERITRVHEQRLVHMRQPHLAALKLSVAPENWSGRLSFRSALDGRVTNSGVARYQRLNNIHLRPLGAEQTDAETIMLANITNQSALRIVMGARTRLFQGDDPLAPERRTMIQDDYVTQLITLEAVEGTAVSAEKVIALYTSRDTAIAAPELEARNALAAAGDFDSLLADHVSSWELLWRRFGIALYHDAGTENADPIAMVVHLYIFHLLQTNSTNTMEMQLDVGVPSRGWHGEAYRGHIFWDELYIFPLLNWRLPQLTRRLLLYRFRRLPAARAAARVAGFEGAMYPWQSGSNGREESQRLHLNPRSGRWLPDNSRLQRHVNIAIAYNLYHYYQVSGDMEFMAFYGGEMMIEIARFLSSLCQFNPAIERYEIHKVMGPDEYHEAYPDAREPGLSNNAYTNVMTVWVLDATMQVLALLPDDVREELGIKLQLRKEELARWKDISHRMRVVFHGDGIISQFEGYQDLKPLDWDAYRKKYGDIQRMDRILEAENDSPNRYQVSKQADALMLFYLLSAEELSEIFQRLGYEFSYDTIPDNIDYYLKHTSHGSTLSRVVHAWVLARSDRVQSWKLFCQALQSDVSDIQGGTTPEGIHVGAMAGTVDLLQRCYTGIVTRKDVLWINPCLPKELNRLRMRLRYRSHLLEVDVTALRLKIRSLSQAAKQIRIGFDNRVYDLPDYETLLFNLKPPRLRCVGESPTENELARRFEKKDGS